MLEPDTCSMGALGYLGVLAGASVHTREKGCCEASSNFGIAPPGPLLFEVLLAKTSPRLAACSKRLRWRVRADG